MENKESKDLIEIDFQQVLSALLYRAWLIVLVGAICAASAFCYAKFTIAPTYSSSIQVYVNNNYESPGFSSSQLSAAQSLADTYMVILESRAVLDEVAKDTNLGYSYSRLKSMVSAASVNGTEIFQVKVVCTNYKHAAIIANSIADVLPEKIAAVVYGSTVSVVDYAVENPNPIGPNYTKYATIGMIAGALLVIAVVVIIEIQNTVIYSEEYLIEAYPDIPLLAVVPDGEDPSTGYYRGYYEAPQKKPADKKAGGGQE